MFYFIYQNIRPNVSFRTVILIFLSFYCASCNGTKKFQQARTIDSIEAYEKFIQEKPKSTFVTEANNRLSVLNEQKLWNEIKNSSKIQDFESYIKNYPEGDFISQATAKIEQIELDRDWSVATTLNSTRSYTEFIQKHPLSTQAKTAKEKIDELNLEKAWLETTKNHTAQSYEAFRRMYPNSKFEDEISKALNELNIVTPAWKKAEKLNSIKGYEDFVGKHPESPQAKIASKRISSLKEKEWENAKSSRSISSVQKYLNQNPNTPYREEAEKLIIDIEVDNIFKSDHGKMPPLEKVKGTETIYRNEVTINNNTDYTLTVRYSGKESHKVVMKPGRASSVSLPNGSYRIAASVNSSSVRSFAGSVSLEGANYESTYYIITERY